MLLEVLNGESCSKIKACKENLNEALKESGIVTEEENLKRLGLEGLAKKLQMCSLQKINPSWLDIPTYVVRRRSRMNGEEKIIEDCGKGLTVDSAIESAVYEAVERRSAEIVKNKEYLDF